MAQKLIDLQLVTQTLQVSVKTLCNGAANGTLSIVQEGSAQYCHEEEIDQLLREGAPDASTPFTWAMIVAQGITFMTQSEAVKQLDVSQSEVSRLGQAGQLCLVRIGRNVRYTKQSVQAISQPKERQCKKHNLNPAVQQTVQPDDLLTYKQTAHVLGVGLKHTLPGLVASKQLTVKRLGRNRYITKDSLVALLPRLLPAWIDPTTWVKDRLASPHGLVYQKVLWATEGDRLMIPDILMNNEVQYISHVASGLPLLSQESYLAYIERCEPYTSKEMFARLFGVSATTITNWDKTYPGWRTCRFHPHTDDRTYRSCALKILERYLSEGSSAWAWYEGRLTYNVPAVDEQTAMKFTGLDESDFKLTTARHNTTTLSTPSGQVQFSANTIMKLARKCWAARSQ